MEVVIKVVFLANCYSQLVQKPHLLALRPDLPAPILTVFKREGQLFVKDFTFVKNPCN